MFVTCGGISAIGNVQENNIVMESSAVHAVDQNTLTSYVAQETRKEKYCQFTFKFQYLHGKNYISKNPRCIATTWTFYIDGSE